MKFVAEVFNGSMVKFEYNWGIVIWQLALWLRVPAQQKFVFHLRSLIVFKNKIQ